jgi:hypothetical protein
MGRLMLARMHRSRVLGHCALVVTLALAVLACTGSAPSAAPPSPRLTLTPTPSVDVGALYAKAAVVAFASDPLILHVVQTAKLTVSDGKKSVKENMSMTMDLSDRDMNASVLTKTAGKTTTDLDIVAVGKSVYAREGNGRWRSGPRSIVEQNITDVIGAIPVIRDPAHLRYVGVETIDKRQLQHLTALRKITYMMSIGQKATFDTFDIWVEADGTPVLMKGKVSAIGPYGVEIEGTNELHFSKFDGPIKIEAPKN